MLLLLSLLLASSPALDAEREQGIAAYEQGDLAGALVHWSLALQEARAAGDGAAESELLLRLATVNRELGRLSEAEDLVAMAHADAGAEANALGLIRMASGDLRKAEKLFKKAFEAWRDADDPQGAANAALNLGLARMAQGSNAEAEKAFSGGLVLFQSLGDRSGEADALNNLGLVHRAQGRLAEARGELEQAVLLFRQVDERQGEADAQTNLGLVLQDLGRDEAAEALYQSALGTARSRRDVPRQAALLVNLGTIAHRSGDLDIALQRYVEAESAYRELGQEAEAQEVALNRARLGRDVLLFEGVVDWAAAHKQPRLEASASLGLASISDNGRAAERALELAESLELGELRWRARYLVGRRELAEGRRSRGLDSLRRSVEELEHSRGGLHPDDGQRYLVGHREVYDSVIGTLIEEGDSAGALLYAERLQLAELPPVEGPPRFEQLRSSERWLEAELSEELSTQGPTERSEALRSELAELRVAFADEVDTLRASYPDFDRLVRVDPEDLEAVQGALDPGVVVLQPVLLEDRLVLMVFRRDSLRAVEVPVEGEQVRKAVSRLTRSLRARMIDDAAFTEGLADQLGHWLLDPVAEELEGAEVLVVTASGPFQQLPFGILRRDGRYLVQDLAVVSVTHVGSLHERSALDTRFQPRGEQMLLVGNPDGSLPAAEAEVKAIAGAFPGAEVHLGAFSREGLEDGMGGKSTLHLATHGVIDPTRPDRSFLVLGSEEDTGRLAYREIPGLAPYLGDARLVVLSACESGLPVTAPEAPGSELAISINGLSAQFRRAGVETLVASLWKVDDAGTRALMEGFYGKLGEGEDVGEALRQAQLALLASEDLAHPWYWGAFVVMGDWR